MLSHLRFRRVFVDDDDDDDDEMMVVEQVAYKLTSDLLLLFT
jgi:hypothetical protein